MRIGDVGPRAVTLMSLGSESTAGLADSALETPMQPHGVVVAAVSIFARLEQVSRREAEGEEPITRGVEFV